MRTGDGVAGAVEWRMSRKRAWIGVAVVAAVALLVVWRVRECEPGPSAVAPVADAAPGQEGDEPPEWLVGPDPLAGEASRDGDKPGPMAWGDGRQGRWGQRRRRFGDGGLPRLSPEQRREWARRRVQIVALGATPPTLEPEAVMEAMRAQMPQIRDCVQGAGGWQALRGASDGGPRQQRSVTFDIGADGAATAGSAAFDPSLSPAIASCMRTAVEQIRVPPPGPDGARVTVSMGGGRGARGGGPRGGGAPGGGPPGDGPGGQGVRDRGAGPP